MSVKIKSTLFGANGSYDNLVDKMVTFTSKSLANKFVQAHKFHAPVAPGSGLLRDGAKRQDIGVGKHAVTIQRDRLDQIIVDQALNHPPLWLDLVYQETNAMAIQIGQAAFNQYIRNIIPGAF